VRKAIPKGVRFDVFKRDRFTCVYCGATPPNVLLHVDHVVAVANGGVNGIDNLVTACQPCNLGKSDKPLDAIPASVKDKADEAAEREAQTVGYQKILADIRNRVECDAWQVADIFNDQFGGGASFPSDWFLSVKRFIERQGLHETLQAMEIAVARKPHSRNTCFIYFCGVCWSKIKQAEA
jgi:HNH endonuclease